VPQSFFLIGDTFYFDDRVEDAARPLQTVAAVVARMLHRRNIGFAPDGGSGGENRRTGASFGRSGGGIDCDDDNNAHVMREDGLPVHEASMFWDLSRPRWPGHGGGASSSPLPSASSSSSSSSTAASAASSQGGTAAYAGGSSSITNSGSGGGGGGGSSGRRGSDGGGGGGGGDGARVARVGDFSVVGMRGVTFASLDIQLGAQYLFFHQGNCEHAFCFVDVRAHHHHHHHSSSSSSSNSRRRRACPAAAVSGGGDGGGGGGGGPSGGNKRRFPRMVFRNKPVQRTCSVCSGSAADAPAKVVTQSAAKFVTFDDRLAGAHATLLESCPPARPPRCLLALLVEC
jgi:hypothetical protein